MCLIVEHLQERLYFAGVKKSSVFLSGKGRLVLYTNDWKVSIAKKYLVKTDHALTLLQKENWQLRLAIALCKKLPYWPYFIEEEKND